VKRYKLLLIALALALFAAACGGDGGDPQGNGRDQQGDAPAEAEHPDVLVIGLVPSREAGALIESAQPLVDALSERLDMEVEGFVPQDYTGLIEAMGTGQAHVGAFGPFGLIQAQDRYGVEIILQSERFGAATYHAQWMTNNPDKYCSDEPTADDDGYLGCNGTTEAEEGPVAEDAIPQVEGATVAYVDPTSTSGYIFPGVQLLDAGIDPRADVDANFTGSHDAAVISVYNGDAEVGLAFDDAREVIAEEFPDVGEKVITFAYSPEIPNDGWAVAPDLPEDLKQDIADALLDYGSTKQGSKVLQEIYEVDALVPADLESFEVVREAAQKLDVPVEE
jgi:phosphonate transport system substrate-binding protein